MADRIFPVLYAPQTDAPILATDSIIVLGRRMSAARAVSEYTPEQLTRVGYRLPRLEDLRDAARRAVSAEAATALTAAVDGYEWPEAAAWESLEAQSRAWLADPSGGPGPDLAADAGADDPALLSARASVIVAKADAFRAARGALVRLRRNGRAAIEAAQDVEALRIAAAEAIAAFGGTRA